MNDKKEIFESMPVPKALATLAIPTIISQLIAMIYSLADTFFIGRSNDPLKVAAVSLSYILFYIMSALSNLFGVGGGSLVSRLLGVNDRENAKRVSSFSFYGSIIIALLYSIFCFIFMDPILRMLGASNNTINYASQYVFMVIVIGGIPSTLNMTMAYFLRSEGYAKESSIGLGSGGILNIILDPIFMFVILPEGYEVLGAGLATMLSNVYVLIYFSIKFLKLRGSTVFSADIKKILPKRQHLISVFSVGFPSTLGLFLACSAAIIMNNLASMYGDITIAAIGIIKRVDLLPLNVAVGLCQGMMPLVAYNYAAKNYSRMKSVAKCSMLTGIVFAAFCIVLFEIFSPTIIKIFINDAQTIEMGSVFLRIICLSVPFIIINFQMNYMFQSIGKGVQSLILSLCRQGVFQIPLLFILNYTFGVLGLIWAQIISEALTFIVSIVFYIQFVKYFHAHHPDIAI